MYKCVYVCVYACFGLDGLTGFARRLGMNKNQSCIRRCHSLRLGYLIFFFLSTFAVCCFVPIYDFCTFPHRIEILNGSNLRDTIATAVPSPPPCLLYVFYLYYYML